MDVSKKFRTDDVVLYSKRLSIYLSNQGYKLNNYEVNKSFNNYLVFYFQKDEELIKIISNSKEIKIPQLKLNDDDILVYDKDLGILLANEGFKWSNIAPNRNSEGSFVMYFKNTAKLSRRLQELTKE